MLGFLPLNEKPRIIPGIPAPLPLYGRYLLQECLSLSMNFWVVARSKSTELRGFVTSNCCNHFQQKDRRPPPATQLFIKLNSFYFLAGRSFGVGPAAAKNAHTSRIWPRSAPSPELASPSEGIMTSTNVSEAGEGMRDGRVDLDGLYGEIGILALVAALRYASDGKNPAYAPRAPSALEVNEAA
jgi:hypothetical protein